MHLLIMVDNGISLIHLNRFLMLVTSRSYARYPPQVVSVGWQAISWPPIELFYGAMKAMDICTSYQQSTYLFDNAPH